MKYLPLTLIVTLSASMLYALVFTPTLGAIFGKPHPEPEHKDGLYMKTVGLAVRHPIVTLFLAVALLVTVPVIYAKEGAGVEFFPNVEPEYGLLYVHARGNLSLAEMDAATAQAENRILGWPGVKSVYTRAGKTRGGGDNIAEDVVGVIQYEFVDWRERKAAHDVLDDLRKAMAGIPGV
ncbi:efflux RND transporter permease subunit, partial [Pseudomonas sp. SB113]